MLSSLGLWFFLACAAQAHEVQPAIADVLIDGDVLSVTIEMPLEPVMAGIDLDGLLDTNASAKASENDRLRHLEPGDLEAGFRAFWPEMQGRLVLRSGGRDIVPDLAEVTIGAVGDPALARVSQLRLTAALPAGGAPLVVGWPADYGALVVRQMGVGGDGYTGYLTGGSLSDPIPRASAGTQTGLSVFANYVTIGFAHIVPKGLDHILFVLGLFFLSLKMRPLLLQVSAFTVAHTITLALGILGIVTIPAAVVEPLIAASIVYVGVENVLTRGLSPWRPAVVFMFGLLHGLGFASVLGDIGLNSGQFVIGLVGFNLGVEFGQLSVIAAAFVLVALPFGGRRWYRRLVSTPASVAISAVGAWWVVERTLL